VAELGKIRGVHSQQIESILGYCPSEVVVHRDDLALVEG
jgi:glutamate 5-kinase